MSRLYFHTRDEGTAELMGFEYHHLCQLVRDVATATLDIHDGERLRSLLRPDRRSTELTGGLFDIRSLDRYKTRIRICEQGILCFDGVDLGTFDTVLNTAMTLGSDPVRLAARIYGQGDIHAWIDGPNRSWIADLIDEGLDTGAYRKGIDDRSSKWEEVQSLLRSSIEAPVVLSYSVGATFPDDRLTDFERDENDESPFDALPADKQWDLAMTTLRSNSKPGWTGLELKPSTWKEARFGYGLSFLDLLADDYRQRIEEALSPSGKGTA